MEDNSEQIDSNSKNQEIPIEKLKGDNALNSSTNNEVQKNASELSQVNPKKEIIERTTQKKEIPIEKKPFSEFINDYLIPEITKEIKDRGFEVEEINLKNTSRPIAGDKCWVISCQIKDTCNFWLSFEKEDISSLKSISLCKSNQEPSVLESFLIDEKRMSLKLITSRIIQRLNGQKLIGIN